MRPPSSFLIAFIGFASVHFSAGAVPAGSSRVQFGAALNVVTVGYLCGLARRWVPAAHSKHRWRKGHCVPDAKSASSGACPEYARFSGVQCAEFAILTER
jgi:hypothetical protein